MRNHPSPNFNERPPDTSVDTIVLHATVFESLEQVIAHFSDPQKQVSAHFTIDKDGTIVSHVAEDKRAWHAGESAMKDGRRNVNDFSIGIELVNRNDGTDPYPEDQLRALRGLLKTLIARHPVRHIIGHYECALPQGRKSDPVGFDKTWFEDLL
jgi:N-acetyl-anhydromuramyl-L-alanine amidase AmpD